MLILFLVDSGVCRKESSRRKALESMTKEVYGSPCGSEDLSGRIDEPYIDEETRSCDNQ